MVVRAVSRIPVHDPDLPHSTAVRLGGRAVVGAQGHSSLEFAVG